MKGNQPPKRGKGHKHSTDEEGQGPSPPERRAAMHWARRLERVLNIDIGVCSKCDGAAKVISCIEDPVFIDKILNHLDKKAASVEPGTLPTSRAPPRVSLFD